MLTKAVVNNTLGECVSLESVVGNMSEEKSGDNKIIIGGRGLELVEAEPQGKECGIASIISRLWAWRRAVATPRSRSERPSSAYGSRITPCAPSGWSAPASIAQTDR